MGRRGPYLEQVISIDVYVPFISSRTVLTKGTVSLKAPYFFCFITISLTMLICRPNDTKQLHG